MNLNTHKIFENNICEDEDKSQTNVDQRMIKFIMIIVFRWSA